MCVREREGERERERERARQREGERGREGERETHTRIDSGIACGAYRTPPGSSVKSPHPKILSDFFGAISYFGG